MKKQTINFLASKNIGYQCFKYLVNEKDNLGLEVNCLLINENNKSVANEEMKTLAQKHHINILHSLNDMAEADFVYSVQYHQILKQPDINKANIIALNLHMAPLPEYRGCNQFTFAILDDKKEFGVTIHQIDTQIDHGAILFEKRFAIPQNCWVQHLHDITTEAAYHLFTTTLQNIVQHDYTLTNQKSLEKESTTQLHFRNEIQDIKIIDLNWEKDKIEKVIRATSMKSFEPPYTLIDNKKIYFTAQWH